LNLWTPRKNIRLAARVIARAVSRLTVNLLPETSKGRLFS
jgi:hypothetical protein